jgi:glutamyl-tRNA synthetase
MSHALAQLLYPHVTRTPADWYAAYPPRLLPEGALVTRFAPSPTGFVHIGSILTSLISRRLAHQSGGVFFLRIEDTDKKREQDGSVEAIVRNLHNFGLTPDEGIVSVDPEREVGAYAPYTQSERIDQYESFAKWLVEHGRAYPCFATEDELERTRKIQEAQKLKTGYYGMFAKWRDASIDQVEAALAEGRRPVIRIRAPYPTERRIRFTDAVKGLIEMPENDMDSVLLKSNRLPTYHFAHVVDDTLMRVNLIIRGDEWLPSAPLHVQVFEYLGLEHPQFAHIAPIAKMDGTSKRKLSKRKDPEADVMYFYAQGYPKAAVIEYLLNLANSDFYDWRTANPALPHDDFPLRIEKLGTSSALFDMVKLNDMSKNHIAALTADEVYEAALAWAAGYHPRLADVLREQAAYARAVFAVERTGDAPRKDIVNWADIERACGFFFDTFYEDNIADGFTWGKATGDRARRILEQAARFTPDTPKDAWLDAMRAFGESIGFARDMKTFKKQPDAFTGHFGDLMMVLRVALTGKTNTPDLYEMMCAMGTARVRARIERALAALPA